MEMTERRRYSIIFIGAGNVATHLAKALAQHHDIRQILARNATHAADLAMQTGAHPIVDIEALDLDVDIIIMAVSDDALVDIIASIQEHHRNDSKRLARITWLHTAGSVSVDVFDPISPLHGVLYPMQTFNKNLPVDIYTVPFFIEGSTSEVECQIKTLANQISANVSCLNSEDRLRLHAAAVLSCNMVTYLWSLAQSTLENIGLDFNIMQPLIQATLDKTRQVSPVEGMTGPARRGDVKTIQKHVNVLAPDIADIYSELSKRIFSIYHPSHSYNMSRINYDLTRIKGFVFDIDGVLSPSTIPMGDDGTPKRMVNIKDGYAIQLAVKHGYHIAIISGGAGEALKLRFSSLGIKDIYLKASTKLEIFKEWLQNNGLKPDEVIYFGDDVPDMQCMQACGLAVAPADAADDAKDMAGYISPYNGGYGVARDVIEQVMRCQGKWLNGDTAFGW